MHKYILVFIALLNILNVKAQIDISTLKKSQLKKVVRSAEGSGDIYTAIDCYERLLKDDPEDIHKMYRLAELYHKSRDYENARKYYKKVYELNPKKYPLSLYNLGIMLKHEGNYKAAVMSFEMFKKEYRKKKIYDDYKKLIRLELESCEIAQSIIDSPLNVDIIHIDTSVNKAHIEFAPLLINDSTLVYSSLKEDGIKYYPSADKQKLPVSKFYLAKKQNDVWKHSSVFKGPFNREGINSGNGALSPDGKRFYFTLCEDNYAGKRICSIYKTTKVNGKWEEPVKLGKHINKPNYTTTQPAIGTESKRNREVLYFVSDRPEGRGGLDIWYAEYYDRINDFKEPKNGGRWLNTSGDEITPYYDMDSRTMYFSSNGWPGIAGFDIFKVTGEKRKWTEPKNIGYPVNSFADDLYFVLNKNDKSKGFFTSNRIGSVALKHKTCCDDIYEFRLKEYIYLAITGKAYTIEGEDSLEYIEKILETKEEINDQLIKTYLDSVVVSLSMKTTDDDDKEENVLIKGDTTLKDGIYFLTLEQGNEYTLSFDKEGYFSKQIEISTVNSLRSDTFEKDVRIMLIPKKPIIVKNIYYPFDKSSLTDSAKAKIDSTLLKLLNSNPSIIIEISSHTDSKGTDRYNKRLSQKRAQSVVNYLISKDIDKERLVAKGYGESQPIAPNTNSDGSDNPRGRQKNRRTEFKVIGKLKKYSDVIYEE